MEQAEQYVKMLTDEQLITKVKECYEDLKDISEKSPNSDEHQECFAAWFYLVGEASNRGIKSNTIWKE